MRRLGRVALLVLVPVSIVWAGQAKPPVKPPPTTLWVAWEQHQSASRDDDALPYWYRPWGGGPPRAVTETECLALVRKESKRRLVHAIGYYVVPATPSIDSGKWIGCLPWGFDPESKPK